MEFYVISKEHNPDPLPNSVHLTRNGWDDWFKFSTLYTVYYFDENCTKQLIGTTKIGEFGLRGAEASSELEEGVRRPTLPNNFRKLPERLFSLGQDPSFYETLTEFGGEFRNKFLRALRDIAQDSNLLEQVQNEEVTQISLLREVPIYTVRDQFARLATGGARLTAFKFSFSHSFDGEPPNTFKFNVVPESMPPTNIHVLVGRNGVGKSTFLNELASTFIEKFSSPNHSSGPAPEPPITNIVSVSFSAFDTFAPIPMRPGLVGLTYHYVGLKQISKSENEFDALKGHPALAEEMEKSARLCLLGARRERWMTAIELLESDPVFASANILSSIRNSTDENQILPKISAIYERLSSGHKIVLLTITRLVETVSEKSLVLIDEPEAHLHPPLLSAFVRALSNLLVNRNGIAIIATHSPVVLQEVPRSCVYKINRIGYSQLLERPNIETFGENVGVLTSEVFGLEVNATGFHRMLWETAQRAQDYNEALNIFDGELGAEGRAVLRAICIGLEQDRNVDI